MADKTVVFDVIARGREQGLDKMHSKMKLVGVAAGALAVKFGVDSVKAYTEAEASQQKLTFAYQKFPKIADVSRGSLDKLNSTLALKTKFDDDATASGEAVLAQYGLTGEQLKTLVPLMQDFAAKTGQDLPTAAGLLGKALLGQGRGLKQIGVNFKDTGSQAGNFGEVVTSLRSKVGGFAEQEGKTAAGQAAILKNEFGEVQEAVGKVAVEFGEKLLPPLIKSAEFVQRNSDVIIPLVGTLGGLAAIVWTVNKATAAWAATQKAVNSLLLLLPGRAAAAATATEGLAVAEGTAATAGGALVGVLGKVGLAAAAAYLVVKGTQASNAGKIGPDAALDRGLRKNAKDQADFINFTARQFKVSADQIRVGVSGTDEQFKKFRSSLDPKLVKNYGFELTRLHDAIGGTAPAAAALAGEQDKVAAATKQVSAATLGAANRQALNADKMANAKAEADALRTSMDRLAGGTLGLAQSETAFRSQLLALTQAEKDNGKTVSLNTEKGLANRQAIEASASSLIDKYNADVKAGKGARASAADFDKSRAAVLRTVAALYGSKSAAYAYAAQITKIPGAKNTKIILDAAAANHDLEMYKTALKNLHDKKITIQQYVRQVILPDVRKTYSQHASGGKLTEGWNMINERGPEWLHKQGSQVQVYPHGTGGPTSRGQAERPSPLRVSGGQVGLTVDSQGNLQAWIKELILDEGDFAGTARRMG